MLMTFIVITNITHKMTIALLTGAVVIFSCFLIFKRLRKCLSVIFALVGVIAFTTSFIGTEKYYLNEMEKYEKGQNLTGVVCEMPTDSDYAFTYIIKPHGKNYKIRYVAERNIFLREGDYVEMTLTKHSDFEETDWLENSLSSKIYFTFFENDECMVKRTNKTNFYYKSSGAIKRGVSEIITSYLPGRNGAIAMAMTIGDKSEVDSRIMEYFNYCGASHLLVISGLHLSLWSVGIIKLLNKHSKLRRLSPFIGILCLLIYSSITGFSVSVIRAGTMVGVVLLGMFVKREPDSINSIGIAVAGIVTLNPFAPYSVSFWLTFLSTTGLVVYSPIVHKWMLKRVRNKMFLRLPFFGLFIDTTSISFSTMVFTLPVFIYKLNMLPTMAILSNFIMVNVALFMMICTIVGVISHLLFLKPVAKMLFFITGVMGEYLNYFAEKIGVWEWSTIPLNHKYYKYFFILILIGTIIVLVLKEYNIDIIKHVTVTLVAMFCIVVVYCTCYEYNTSFVEIAFTSSKPVVTVFSKGESALVGVYSKKYEIIIKDQLNKHNEKQLDYIAVTENESKTNAELIYLYETFGESQTYFRDEAPEIFKENTKSLVMDFMVAENVDIDISNSSYIEIKTRNKSVLVVDCKKAENIYENSKYYDIIILYSNNLEEIKEELTSQMKNSYVIVSEDGKKVSVHM